MIDGIHHKGESRMPLRPDKGINLIISKQGCDSTDQKIDDDYEDDLVFATQKTLTRHDEHAEQKYRRRRYVVVKNIVHTKTDLSLPKSSPYIIQ